MKLLLDTPDDQTLTPPAITSSEDTLYIRRVFLIGDDLSKQFPTATPLHETHFGWSLDVRPSVLFDAQCLGHSVLRSQEP